MNALALMAADASASGSGSMMTSFITFGMVIVIFYFMIIRPQKKRDKEAKAMLAAMKKGDRVVTIGGIHGTIVTVKDNTVVVKVDDSARIEFSKNAISTVTARDAVKVAPKEQKVEEETKAVEAETTEEK
jgi:preprotein translocase subunit YajC